MIQGRTALKTLRDSLFADNTTGDITPVDLRTFEDSIIDSFVNINDDAYGSSGNFPLSRGFLAQGNSQDQLAGLQIGPPGHLLMTNAVGGHTYTASGGFVAASTELTFDVTLTQADILSLNSSPFTLVNAPAAGKLIFITAAPVVFYTYSAAAFASNTNLAITHGSSPTSNVLGSVIDQTSNQVACFGQVQWTGSAAAVLAQALKITVTGGNPTAGNAGSSLRVYGKYIIV